jgi:hypothetical protein
MDGDDLELFERSLRHAVELHSGIALDAALDELGWPDALADDPRTAVATLFELQGAANVTSSALDHVVTTALGVERATTTGVVLPPIGRWDPPGTIDGHDLRLDGLVTAGPADVQSLIIVAARGDKDIVVTVPASMLALRPVEGIDPSLDLRSVTTHGVRIPAEPEIAPRSWTSGVAAGRLALAHELVGASRKMLELAVRHAVERIQFGRPIGSFQAIRHRLAETFVGIEMADAVLDAAWLDGSPQTAAMAKSVAGRQARATARHCQQVLAGIGFTTDHSFHRYLKRTIVLDGLFGSADDIALDLGRTLLRTRTVPTLIDL